MRSKLALSMFSLSLLFVPFAVAGTKATWTVASAAEIDGRIQRQLRRLAIHNGAALRFSRDTGPNPTPTSRAGSLLIQLDSVGDTGAFLGELIQEARSSAVTPTTDLVREGYLLRVTYSRRSAPIRIRIEATSPEGFHNTLLRVSDLLVTRASRLLANLIPRPQSLRLEKGDTEAVLADYPSFPIRGIVEGF